MGNKQIATWNGLDLLDLKIENICYVFISFYETMYFFLLALTFFRASFSSVFIFLLLSFLLFLWRDTITIEPYGFWIVAFFLSLVLCLYYVFTCIALLFEPLKYRLQNGLASARSTFYSLLAVKPSV